MKLPLSVKIGPLTYAVEEAMPVLDDGSLIGESLHCQGLIRVRADLPEQQKELTFVHEVVHALMYVAGYPGGGDEHIDTTAESLTSRITFALYGFLKDNGFWPQDDRRAPDSAVSRAE